MTAMLDIRSSDRGSIMVKPSQSQRIDIIHQRRDGGIVVVVALEIEDGDAIHVNAIDFPQPQEA